MPLTCGANAASRPDMLGRAPRALAKQLAKPLPCANLLQRPHQRVAVAEPEPRCVNQAPFGTLHGPGDGAAADTVSIPSSSQRRWQPARYRVRHPAHRAEREDVLVLHPHLFSAASGVDVLTADGARGTAVARDAAQLGQVLGGELRRPGEVAAWKLRVGRVPIALKASRLASVPELTVLGRRRAEGAGAQVAGCASTAGGSAGATLVAACTAMALSRLAPITAPSPPRPACRPSWETVA